MLPVHSSSRRRGGNPIFLLVSVVTGVICLVLAGLNYSNSQKLKDLTSTAALLESQKSQLQYEVTELQNKIHSKATEIYNWEHSYAATKRKLDDLQATLQQKEAEIKLNEHQATFDTAQLNQKLQDVQHELEASRQSANNYMKRSQDLEKLHRLREDDWHNLAIKWKEHEKRLLDENNKLLEHIHKIETEKSAESSHDDKLDTLPPIEPHLASGIEELPPENLEEKLLPVPAAAVPTQEVSATLPLPEQTNPENKAAEDGRIPLPERTVSSTTTIDASGNVATTKAVEASGDLVSSEIPKPESEQQLDDPAKQVDSVPTEEEGVQEAEPVDENWKHYPYDHYFAPDHYWLHDSFQEGHDNFHEGHYDDWQHWHEQAYTEPPADVDFEGGNQDAHHQAAHDTHHQPAHNMHHQPVHDTHYQPAHDTHHQPVHDTHHQPAHNMHHQPAHQGMPGHHPPAPHHPGGHVPAQHMGHPPADHQWQQHHGNQPPADNNPWPHNQQHLDEVHWKQQHPTPNPVPYQGRGGSVHHNTHDSQWQNEQDPNHVRNEHGNEHHPRSNLEWKMGF